MKKNLLKKMQNMAQEKDPKKILASAFCATLAITGAGAAEAADHNIVGGGGSAGEYATLEALRQNGTINAFDRIVFKQGAATTQAIDANMSLPQGVTLVNSTNDIITITPSGGSDKGITMTPAGSITLSTTGTGGFIFSSFSDTKTPGGTAQGAAIDAGSTDGAYRDVNIISGTNTFGGVNAPEGNTASVTGTAAVDSLNNSAYGGAISASNDVNISGSTNLFGYNTAESSVNQTGNAGNTTVNDAAGGAIYVQNDLDVTNSTNQFINNTAEASGNTNTANAGNTADTVYNSAVGGAVYAGGDASFSGGSNLFGGNTAIAAGYGFGTEDNFAAGGAIYGGAVSFAGGENSFYGNFAFGGYDTAFRDDGDAYGGAIYSETDVDLTNSSVNIFEYNGAEAVDEAKGGAIYAENNVNITGSAAGFYENYAYSEDYNAAGGAIYAEGTVNITNSQVEFSENTVDAYDEAGGGAIAAEGAVNITNSIATFTDNATDAYGSSYGGAISSSMDGVHITGSNVSFEGNKAYSEEYEAYGGAIYAYDDVEIKSSTLTFTGNNALGYELADGGAISSYDYSVNIANSNVTFTENYTSSGSDDAASYGGAISAGLDVNITGSNAEFTDNYSSAQAYESLAGVAVADATAYGGAIYAYGDVNITNDNNVTFTGNYATADAEAVATNASSATATANAYGGAIYSDSGNVNIANSNNIAFIENYAIAAADATTNGGVATETANAYGGAIYASDGSVDITGSRVDFTGNYVTADNEARGGAIYASSDDVNITGSNTTFSGNIVNAGDDGYGGAIYSNYDVNITGGNTYFTNNMINAVGEGYGAAMYVDESATFDLGANDNIIMYGNQIDDSNGSYYESVYFGNFDNETFAVNGQGRVFMWDPIAVETAGMTINKDGSGQWLLGGYNYTEDATWNINSGQFITDYGADSNTAEYNPSNTNAHGDAFELDLGDNGSFNLGNGANMYVTTSSSGMTDAEITGGVGSTINLNGQIDINTKDFRDGANFVAGQKALLILDESSGAAVTNNSSLGSTSGKIEDGFYDISYSNLRWIDTNSDGTNDLLAVSLDSRSVSTEGTGVHLANGVLYSAVANGTADHIFARLQGGRLGIKLDEDKVKGRTLWGAYMNNRLNTDRQGSEAKAKTKAPGIILGMDKQLSDTALIGVAISAVWPEHEQGRSKTDGHDVRLSVYGNKKFKNDLQLDWLTSFGYGNLDTTRTRGYDRMYGDYDTKMFEVGLGLSKNIDLGKNKKLRPFLTYEYMHVKSDGFNEKTRNIPISYTALHIDSHTEDLSRARLGLEYSKTTNKNKFSGSVFYQRLFGDRSADATSMFIDGNNMGSVITHSGAGLDKNAFGLTLGYGRNIGKNTNVNISYSGLFGSNSDGHAFSAGFEFKF